MENKKKNILIATIGGNDIKLIVNGQAKKLSSARDEGKKLFENLKIQVDNVEMPLISETVKYLLKEGVIIDTLYLIVTDQEDPDNSFSTGDTLWFGKIISSVLKSKKYARYREKVKWEKFSVNNTDLICLRKYVNDFEENLLSFTRNLNLQRLLKKQDEIENIYIEYTGGIPEITYAFIIYAIFNFENRKIIPVIVDKKDGFARKSRIVSEISEKFRYLQLQHFLHKYEYKYTVDRMDLPDNIKRALFILASRLDFNFMDSYHHLKVLRESDKSLYEKLNTFLKEDLDFAKRLEELYFHLEIKLKNHEYLDFLSRFYAFYDNWLYYILKQYNYDVGKMKTEKERKTCHKSFIQGIKELDEFLKGVVEQKKISPDYHENFSTKVRYYMVEYFHQNSSEFEKIKSINAKFSRLIEKRNRTVISHRLEGITENDFSDIYGPDYIQDLLTDLRYSLHFIGIDPGQNIFDKLNEIIITELMQKE